MKISEMVTRFKPSIVEPELQFLVPHVRALNPHIIIEVGSFRGGSTLVWRQLLEENNEDDGFLIAVDPNPQREFYMRFPEKTDSFMFVKEKSGSGDALNAITQRLQGLSADFIFIDGDHSQMAQDFLLYWGFLRKGGGMAFHDFGVSGKKTAEHAQNMGWRREYAFSPHLVDISETKPKSPRWGMAMIWKEKGELTIHGKKGPKWTK